LLPSSLLPSSLLELESLLKVYKFRDHTIIFARWCQQTKNEQVTLGFAMHLWLVLFFPSIVVFFPRYSPDIVLVKLLDCVYLFTVFYSCVFMLPTGKIKLIMMMIKT